jgi:transcriptional regulator with XRE-family HTH domain
MSALDIGGTIRGARSTARMTQGQLGGATGYSASSISRIEAGRLQPNLDTLARFATVLNIDPARLGLARVVASGHDPQEDAVRRRNLLAGAAGLGFTLATGLPATPAPAAPCPTPVDPAAGLEAALFSPPAAEPVPLPKLTRGLAAAKADFTGARYVALGEHLPALLAAAEATRDASTGRAREQAQAAVARAYVLATELAFKQHADFAWATADRALTAARASGDPVVIGEAARVLGITMRRAGRPGAAVDLLRHTADQLDEGQAAEQAVAATMLLTAAYTAASDGRRSDALDLMGHADSMVARAAANPGRALFTVDATAVQVDSYWVSVHNALGTPDEAVPYANRLDAVAWTSPERAARAATDVARMWHRLGDQKRMFAALRQVEAAAPEEVRRPALRALTASALYGPAAVPGLREFARRTGAI